MSDPVPIAIHALPEREDRFRPTMPGTGMIRGDSAPARTTQASVSEAAADEAYRAGVAAAEADFADERERLLALVASCVAFRPEPSEELGQLIARTVMMLVNQIIGNQPLDTATITRRAMAAASLISEADAARRIMVHPDDVAIVAAAAPGLSVEADATAMRGDIRIECSAGWVEHGTSLYLERLRQALGLGAEQEGQRA